MPSRSPASWTMGRIEARCAISMLPGKGAEGAEDASGMAWAVASRDGGGPCYQSRTPRVCRALVTIRPDVVAEGFPRGVRGDLVRGAVLPPAPVRLPRGDRRQIGRHTSELQSLRHLVCRLLLEKKNNKPKN